MASLEVVVNQRDMQKCNQSKGKAAKAKSKPEEPFVASRWTSEASWAELRGLDPEALAGAVRDVLERLQTRGNDTLASAERRAAGLDVAGLIRGLGAAGLWRLGLIDAIRDLLDGGLVEGIEGALFSIESLVKDEVGCAWFEPYAVDLLPIILRKADHKASPVRVGVERTLRAIVVSLNPRAARLVLPQLFESMESPDWRIKYVAVSLVGSLAKNASSQINICMPMIVPRLTTCLRDTKKEVSKAARSALTEACSVIGNPDIDPVVPSVIAAIKDPKNTPKALDNLLHTTFVHTVDAATLSVIVPVLARSLVDRGMHPKRKTATVIVNMCKLVQNPVDVEPFVPKLLPELVKCAEEAAFEEIRDVCADAVAVLTKAMEDANLSSGAMEAANLASS